MFAADTAQMARIDEYAIDKLKIPSTLLMDRAARKVADEALRLLGSPQGKRVCVFCGRGKNGGDGLAAARRLFTRGIDVRVYMTQNMDRAAGDTLEMLRRMREIGLELSEFSGADEKCIDDSDLLIDALFGTGFHGTLEGQPLRAAQMMNRSKVPVLSVDMPSGVSGDTGEADINAVKAVLTVTFTLPKTGQLLLPLDGPLGRMVVADIGITQEALDSQALFVQCLDRALVSRLMPVRHSDSHKGDYGKALLLCGSTGLSGAARFASQGAAKSGAGLVTLCVPETIYEIAAGQAEEVMVHPLPAGKQGTFTVKAIPAVRQWLDWCDVLLAGPGLGRNQDIDELIRGLLAAAQVPIVLDADGINALTENIDVIINAAGPVVLTPHEGEFVRIGGDISDPDRISATRRFSLQHKCVLVRKGHRTIIAAPDGRVRINTTGNDGMSKGGSGDILAGMITSLIGQGMQPFDAASCAVYFHGRAGDICMRDKGKHGMAPSDMLDKIADAMMDI